MHDPAELSGTRIGRYEVLSLLGSGGMGDVYDALDPSLGRHVALKILPPELVSHRGRLERFVQEARAASAMNHPHIVSIYEIGDDAGVHFIAMEKVAGATLRETLGGGRLPRARASELVAQIADAVGAAHAAGIVHRDLKPDNVMVSDDGYVKVLDFGLAKLTAAEPPSGESETIERQTVAGAILGTAGYMSPEQARGRPVDHRADIFALGCILYEAVAGRRAFAGESQVETLHKIIHDEPAPVQDAPAELQRIIRKALAKDPAARYQSARELAADLRDVERRPSGRGDRLKPVLQWAFAVIVVVAVGFVVWKLWPVAKPGASVAILPFATSDAADAWLGIGMADAIITRLGNVPQIVVRPTSAIVHFRGANAAEAGRQLAVSRVVEGRVQRAGGRIRFTVQMTDPATQRMVWADTFEQGTYDLLLAQDEVAQRVAAALLPQLSSSERASVRRRETDNPEAYRLYIEGRVLFNQFTPDAMQAGIERVQRAVRLDPRYVRAWAWLANAWSIRSDSQRDAQWLQNSRAAAAQALRLDPNDPEAIMAAALNRFWNDWQRDAGADYRRAVDLAPSNPELRHYYAWFLMAHGRFREAEAETERVIALDPLNPLAQLTLGMCAYFARDYDRAEALFRRTAKIVWMGDYYLGKVLLAKGDTAGAIAAFERAHAASHGLLPEARLGIAAARAKRGDAAAAKRAAQEAEANPRAWSLDVAAVYAALGDRDAAFRAMRKAVDRREKWIAWIKINPDFDPLRGDPRFAELVRLAGY